MTRSWRKWRAARMGSYITMRYANILACDAVSLSWDVYRLHAADVGAAICLIVTMPPRTGHKKKQQLKVAILPSLLHLPHSDSTAAAKVARSVSEAVEELAPAGQQQRTSSKSGSATGVPYVGVLLQAAGWLARAGFQQDHPDAVRQELATALVSAWHVSIILLQQREKITLEHLRPALRPCPEDDVTPGGCLRLGPRHR